MQPARQRQHLSLEHLTLCQTHACACMRAPVAQRKPVLLPAEDEVGSSLLESLRGDLTLRLSCVQTSSRSPWRRHASPASRRMDHFPFNKMNQQQPFVSDRSPSKLPTYSSSPFVSRAPHCQVLPPGFSLAPICSIAVTQLTKPQNRCNHNRLSADCRCFFFFCLFCLRTLETPTTHFASLHFMWPNLRDLHC